jgi:hypothetical protein
MTTLPAGTSPVRRSMALNAVQTLVDSITDRMPQPGYVKKILESMPAEAGLFRRQSLRKHASRETRRAPPSDIPSSTSGDSQSNGSKGSDDRPKSEGAGGISTRIGSGSGGSSLHSSEIGPLVPDNEEVRRFLTMANIFLTSSHVQPLRVGHLWYLHVHREEPFIWIRCRAILFRTQLQLSWVEHGGGRAVINLDLLNCHEVRSSRAPFHRDAWDDIGSIAARNQANPDQAFDFVNDLCPFQLLYEDGVERLAASSQRERVRWVGAIW